MSIALPRNAFPLAVTGIALVFLGLFLLYPLYRIFGASFLDASGASFTLNSFRCWDSRARTPYSAFVISSRNPAIAS